MALNIVLPNWEFSKLRQVQSPQYQFLIAKLYMYCVLIIVGYMVKVLVETCILTPNSFLIWLHTVRIFTAWQTLQSHFHS